MIAGLECRLFGEEGENMNRRLAWLGAAILVLLVTVAAIVYTTGKPSFKGAVISPPWPAPEINLTEDDKVDIQRIRTKLEADESLRAVLNADNPRDAKVYKFNQVLVRLLLEFVHTKLDLYKKLTEPKVNETLKRQRFEVLASGS